MADTTPTTLTLVPWAPGTPVGAYRRRSEQLRPDGPPTGVPPTDTQIVTADASLTYDIADGEYWAAAPLNGSGTWQYVAFLAETDEPTVTDERLDAVEANDVALDARLDVVEANDVAFDSRLDAVEADDVSTDTRLDVLEAKTAVHLNDYLPAGFASDSTDCTAAITAWASAAQAVGNARGSVRMLAAPGVYRYTAAIGGIQVSLTGIGVDFDADGATFADQRSYTSGVGRFMRLTACRGVRVKFRSTSQYQAGTALPFGLVACELQQGTTVDRVDVETVGGREGVTCGRLSGDPESYRTHGGRITVRASGTFYGWAGQFSGNDHEVHVDADDCGRAFIIYGCHNTKIFAKSKNQRLASPITMYGAFGCSNIDVDWTDTESTQAASGVELHFRWESAFGPGAHRNIDIRLNVRNTANATAFRAFRILKTDESLGTIDGVGHGHTLDGLKIRGYVEFTASGQVRDMVSHYGPNDGEMVAPDAMRNLDFSDLTIKSGSTNDRSIFRMTCLDGVAVVRNLHSTQDFFAENQNNGRVLFTGCKAKRLSQDATDAHTYVDCEVSGAGQALGSMKRYVGTTKGINMGDPYAPHWMSGVPGRLWLPATAKIANIERANTLADVNWLTSGTLKLAPLGILRAGDSLAGLVFYSGATPAGGPTNQWACLVRASDLKIKAISNDKLTAAWAAQSGSLFSLGAAYSPLVDELLYVGLMVAATTVPSSWGVGTSNAIGGVAPGRWGFSTTGLTAPLALDTVVVAPAGDSKFGYAYAT